jgi:hypothetical protein
MHLRYPPSDYLERMGLVIPPDPDGLYEVRHGRFRLQYPPGMMRGQVWEGPAEVDNATKRLAVGMYALQTAEEWQREDGASARCIRATLDLYTAQPGLLTAPGKLSVCSILLELHALLRLLSQEAA